MMMKRALTLVAGAALALTLAACGSDSTTASSSTSAAGSAAVTSEAMTSEAMTSEAMESGSMSSEAMESEAMSSGEMSSGEMSSGDMAAPALVGAGCADYAEAVPTGAGSVDGMAQDPVATAASNNPILTTLTAAVSGKVNPDVDLVTTLNNGEFTVFAPVDDAFKKIDAATMTTLTTDAELLSGILTYHVVPGQLSPTDVVGTHPTANGAELTVTGSGDNLEVNGAAVICGGVKTKNATVYLIDTVLTPPAG
jgi:pentapeptide MXKDX repeat protein